MVGTKAGGRKARKTNYLRYGDDFYKRIGARGGRNSHSGGFAANPELARIAGAIGGRKSRRSSENSRKIKANADKIALLLDDGLNYSEIARTLQVPYQNLWQWIKKEGLK